MPFLSMYEQWRLLLKVILIIHINIVQVLCLMFLHQAFNMQVCNRRHKTQFHPFHPIPVAQQDILHEAHVKTGLLTLSVSEVEEQTQDKQQRQQQRGSGSVHGGTAWHQHALAASVALAHRAL